MPVAGGIRLPSVWAPAGLRTELAAALAVCQVQTSGVGDGWYDFAQNESSPDGLVLGSVLDDHWVAMKRRG